MSDDRQLAVALRPQTLNEYLGSPQVLNQVRTFLASGRIPTAILLSGPTGCGKTTLARCITKALGGEPEEANAADDTGVDAARNLGEKAAYRPLTGDWKVIILDEAHQLTKQAQNALLKHVEDAAPSTIWIFCTTEPSKLLPTLRGRCLSLALGGLTAEQTALLVYRGLAYLGKSTGATPQIEEFIKLLVRENITAPRSILNATDRFATGVDPIAAVFGDQASPTAFEIARAAFNQDWNKTRELLVNCTTEEAMTIRMVCVNYFKSALLKSNSGHFCSQAIVFLTQSIPFDGPLGLAELSARLWDICYKLDAPRR